MDLESRLLGFVDSDSDESLDGVMMRLVFKFRFEENGETSAVPWSIEVFNSHFV